MGLGSLASACYFVAAIRIARAGAEVKFLAYPGDVLRVLRQYRAMAQQQSWPLWPIHAFWVLLPPALCAAGLAFLFFNPTAPSSRPPIMPTARLALLWTSVSSLLIALVFSLRIYRHASETATDRAQGRSLFRSPHIRNDLYLALLGWAGFVLGLLALSLKELRAWHG